MKVRELIGLLEANGWVLARTNGSHRLYNYPEHERHITVPGNLGKEMAVGTLQSILKEAGLK